MNKYVILGLAAILTAAGTAAKGYAEGAAEDPAAPAGEPTDKPRRGRPPAGETKTPENAPAGPTDAERFEKNRELIKPLVEGGQGAEVKTVIAKYSKTGLKDIPATSQADFEKDLSALSY